MPALIAIIAQDASRSAVPRDKVALVIASLVCVLGLWIWWTFMGRKRLIQDLPTSRAKGVALGLNELIGAATPAAGDPGGVVTSPYGHVECVWWHQQFYKKDSDGDWKRSRERQGGPVAFALADQSGSVLVRPRKADISGEEAYDDIAPADLEPDASLVTRYLSTRTSEEKVVETVIPLGVEVYVLGTARLPHDSLSLYVGEDPDARRPFMIRVGSEDDALYRERVGVFVGFVLAVVGVVAASVSWFERRAIADETFALSAVDWVVPIVFTAALLVVMGAASLVFVHNNLVELRQRTQSAWSLIDVQLRRRHDLIPNLVSSVRGHAAHERDVLTAVTELRSHLAHDLPAEPTDAAVATADLEITAETGATRRLVALLEGYPDVRADESFAALRAELVDTEDRVALAREFYNNSVLALHDRATSLPGSLIAWIFELDLRTEFTSGDPPLAGG